MDADHGPQPGGATTRLTWVGHSTARLDHGGSRILTDPLLARRVATSAGASPRPTQAAPRPTPSSLPRAHGRGPPAVAASREGASTAVVPRGAADLVPPGRTSSRSFLFRGMDDLGHVTVALLPIWGWGPTLGTGHLDPTRAVEATRRIGPDVVVPVHWGTYSPENGRRGAPPWLRTPVRRFAAELDAAGLSGRLRLLEPGEGLSLRAPAGSR